MESNKIRFSVIMPSYKMEELYITRSIESVLKQTFRNFEIIVIDDNDKGPYQSLNMRLSSRYHSRNVKFIFNGYNKGANYARNNGIRNAKGEFVAFLDSDDTWDENYLEQVDNVIKESGYNLIACDYKVFNGTNLSQPVFDRNVQISGDIHHRELYGDILGPTSTICVKRQSLLDAGLFDETLPARQDYDMWLRVSKIEKCYFLYNALVTIYWDGHDSITKSYKKALAGTKVVLDKILNSEKMSEKERKYIVACHYESMGQKCIGNNSYKEAIPYLTISLKNNFRLKTSIKLIFCCLPFLYRIQKSIKR